MILNVSGRSYDVNLYLYSLLLLLLIFYLLLKSNWIKRVQLALMLPGPSALPIIGNCLLATDSEALVKLGNGWYENYGPIIRIWISFLPCFGIVEPKDIQNVLTSNKNMNRAFFYQLMSAYLGNGLITSNGKKWKINRKLLQPSFNINVLEIFLESFSKSANSLIKNLNHVITNNNNVIKVTTFVNRSVVDVVYETIIGIEMKENRSEDFMVNSPFRQFHIWTQDRIKRPWLLFDSLFKLTKDGKDESHQSDNMHTIIKNIIKLRKKERCNGVRKSGRTCLLELLLDIEEENAEFSENDVVDELCTLIFAGQDSIATSISFCLYFLAKHKNYQERVYEEQQTIFHNSNRTPTLNDLNDMKYLEQCINETLRLIPSVPIIIKKVGQCVQVGKYNIPPGSILFISPYATHHLAHIYPDPNTYNPDRFTSEEIQKRHPFAFIPFSAGPRNCIGKKFALLEIKTLISTIIRSYELSLNSDYELQLRYLVTVKAKGGIPLRVVRRKTNLSAKN